MCLFTKSVSTKNYMPVLYYFLSPGFTNFDIIVQIAGGDTSSGAGGHPNGGTMRCK